MKIILFLIVLSALIWAEVKEVKVIGYGETFLSAKKDAIRNAVEQVSGVKLKSKSLVTEGMLEEDKISSSTNGIVDSFSLVDSKKDTDGDFVLTLKVQINPDRMTKENLDEFIENKKSMRMFTKENFHSKSVMVLYSTRGMKQAMKEDQEASLALIDDVQDELVDKSFDVKHKTSLSDTIFRTDINDEDAIAYGKLAESDIVILGTITATKQIKEDGYSLIKTRVILKAYETTTGRLLANISEKASGMIETTSSIESSGFTKTAKKAAEKSVHKLIKKFIERMNTGSNQFILLTFKDVDIDTQDRILDMIEEKKLEFKVEKQYGDIMQVKIISDEAASGFRRKFRKWLQKSNIDLKPIMTQGSEITYTLNGKMN